MNPKDAKEPKDAKADEPKYGGGKSSSKSSKSPCCGADFIDGESVQTCPDCGRQYTPEQLKNASSDKVHSVPEKPDADS